MWRRAYAPNPAGFARPRSRGFALGGTVATRHEPPATPLTRLGQDRNVSTLPTDHRFTGQISDASGLIFMNARYYDPVLGSFLSPDTLVPEPGQPEGYNRYAYANRNSVLFCELSGHIVWTEFPR